MARYPGAVWHPLPQNTTQLHINPVGVVLHTAVSDGTSLYNFFDGKAAGVESHFYVREDGTVEQYMDTEVRADCQLDGNSWLDNGTRYGFISIETWDGGKPATTPWNDKQLAAIVALIAWASKTHGFPAIKATGPHGKGIGYHAQFTTSSTSSADTWNHTHSCPAALRTAQVPTVIARVVEALKPPAPPPAPAPTPVPEEFVPLKPAQLVKVKGDPRVFAVTLAGCVHVKNPTHLTFLRAQGWVSADIQEITHAQLYALKEGS